MKKHNNIILFIILLLSSKQIYSLEKSNIVSFLAGLVALPMIIIIFSKPVDLEAIEEKLKFEEAYEGIALEVKLKMLRECIPLELYQIPYNRENLYRNICKLEEAIRKQQDEKELKEKQNKKENSKEEKNNI